MLRLDWKGSDWPVAKTPLTTLEALYGHKTIDDKLVRGYYFRINGKPFDTVMHDNAEDAKQAAEDKYFELVIAELSSANRCLSCGKEMIGQFSICHCENDE